MHVLQLNIKHIIINRNICVYIIQYNNDLLAKYKNYNNMFYNVIQK